MNENLDLVKILKDVPKGTELYSPLFGAVTFVKIDSSCRFHPVIVADSAMNLCWFASDGKYYAEKDGECLLFPSKENRDWSTFTCLKPGDFVYRELKSGNKWISIHKKEENGQIFSFVNFCIKGGRSYSSIGNYHLCYSHDVDRQREVTPAERVKLIQEMLNRGEIFDKDKCKLVELQPGTIIKVETENGNTWYSIFRETGLVLFSYVDFLVRNSNLSLWCSGPVNKLCPVETVLDVQLASPEEEELCMQCLKENGFVWDKETLSLTQRTFEKQEETTFKPFQEVLVRDIPDQPWQIDFFSQRIANDDINGDYPYKCLKNSWRYCIPFKGNEDKVGRV